MDALKFVREINRMCKSFGDNCEDCPANDVSGCIADQLYEEMVPIVEKWSKENPRKTRQSVFLEQWPEAQLENDGVLTICPSTISSTHRSQYGGCGMRSTPCSDCCREFWMQEVE